MTRVKASRLFEVAGLLLRFNHIARFIINANHILILTAEKLGVADCVLPITRRQNNGRQIAPRPQRTVGKIVTDIARWVSEWEKNLVAL